MPRVFFTVEPGPLTEQSLHRQISELQSELFRELHIRLGFSFPYFDPASPIPTSSFLDFKQLEQRILGHHMRSIYALGPLHNVASDLDEEHR